MGIVGSKEKAKTQVDHANKNSSLFVDGSKSEKLRNAAQTTSALNGPRHVQDLRLGPYCNQESCVRRRFAKIDFLPLNIKPIMPLCTIIIDYLDCSEDENDCPFLNQFMSEIRTKRHADHERRIADAIADDSNKRTAYKVARFVRSLVGIYDPPQTPEEIAREARAAKEARDLAEGLLAAATH